MLIYTLYSTRYLSDSFSYLLDADFTYKTYDQLIKYDALLYIKLPNNIYELKLAASHQLQQFLQPFWLVTP